MVKRWKVCCAYDGTDYCGWQVQPNAVSIQAIIEKRLEIVMKTPVRIHGSGRTDAGVHAAGQVFHFDAEWDHAPEKLLRAMQSTMPDNILLTKIQPVKNDFHARFSATGKCYRYRIYCGIAPPHLSRFHWSLRYGATLDEGKMAAALAAIVGWHDFHAFAVNRGEPYEHTWRCITRADSRISGKVITLSFEGNGFLYKMVRGLTGAVVGVASGRLNPELLVELLEGRTRGACVATAPPNGLSLEKVYYRKRDYPPPPPHVAF